jgi:hypothetical protein
MQYILMQKIYDNMPKRGDSVILQPVENIRRSIDVIMEALELILSPFVVKSSDDRSVISYLPP